MKDAMKPPKTFGALTELGLSPMSARQLKAEPQSSTDLGIDPAIDPAIDLHRQGDHALLMTKADGTALQHHLHIDLTGMVSTLRKEMAEMRSEMRLELTAFNTCTEISLWSQSPDSAHR